MPTKLLLAHPDLKTQRHICEGTPILKLAMVKHSKVPIVILY
jgi:hypothetical protein